MLNLKPGNTLIFSDFYDNIKIKYSYSRRYNYKWKVENNENDTTYESINNITDENIKNLIIYTNGNCEKFNNLPYWLENVYIYFSTEDNSIKKFDVNNIKIPLNCNLTIKNVFEDFECFHIFGLDENEEYLVHRC